MNEIEIKIGTAVMHVDPDANWHATFMKIDGDDLHVKVKSKGSRAARPEIWDLSSTKKSIFCGDFIVFRGW